MQKDIPNVLWIAIISTGIMIGLKIVAAMMVGPLVLIDAALTAVLLYGIIKGHKWAFYLTIVAIILGTILGFRKGIQSGFIILAIDCLVLVPVLMSRDYFFPSDENSPGLSSLMSRQEERI